MRPKPLSKMLLHGGTIPTRVNDPTQLLTELDAVGNNAQAIEPQEGIASDARCTLIAVHERMGERKANDKCRCLVYESSAFTCRHAFGAGRQHLLARLGRATWWRHLERAVHDR
jgi:hypothetical protein